MIGSTIIGIIIYIALQVVFLAALPAHQIGHTWANSAFSALSGPFAQVATLISLGWLSFCPDIWAWASGIQQWMPSL